MFLMTMGQNLFQMGMIGQGQWPLEVKVVKSQNAQYLENR